MFNRSGPAILITVFFAGVIMGYPSPDDQERTPPKPIIRAPPDPRILANNPKPSPFRSVPPKVPPTGSQSKKSEDVPAVQYTDELEVEKVKLLTSYKKGIQDIEAGDPADLQDYVEALRESVVDRWNSAVDNDKSSDRVAILERRSEFFHDLDEETPFDRLPELGPKIKLDEAARDISLKHAKLIAAIKNPENTPRKAFEKIQLFAIDDLRLLANSEEDYSGTKSRFESAFARNYAYILVPKQLPEGYLVKVIRTNLPRKRRPSLWEGPVDYDFEVKKLLDIFYKNGVASKLEGFDYETNLRSERLSAIEAHRNLLEAATGKPEGTSRELRNSFKEKLDDLIPKDDRTADIREEITFFGRLEELGQEFQSRIQELAKQKLDDAEVRHQVESYVEEVMNAVRDLARGIEARPNSFLAGRWNADKLETFMARDLKKSLYPIDPHLLPKKAQKFASDTPGIFRLGTYGEI